MLYWDIYPGDRVFFKCGDLYPRDFNSQRKRIFEIWGFYLNVGIYIPGILFKCGDLYPRDFNPQGLGIFEIWGFLSSGLGIFMPGNWGFLKILGYLRNGDFLSPGFFGNGDFVEIGIFFVGWDSPRKSHLWMFTTIIESS